MDREILFRGKRKSSRKKYQTWVYGSLFLEKGYCNIQFYTEGMMSIDDADVIQKTVGQYTGLTDKNGNKIFEGDIMKHTQKYDISEVVVSAGVVKWSNGYGAWIITSFNNGRADMFLGNESRRVEIIGNIHDNPELLEVSE